MSRPLPDQTAPAKLGHVVRSVEVRPPRAWPLFVVLGGVPMALGVATAARARSLGPAIAAAVLCILALVSWMVAFLVRGQATRTTLYDGGFHYELFQDGRLRREVALAWSEIESIAHRAVDRFRGKRYVGSQARFGLRATGAAGGLTLRRRISYRREQPPDELALWLDVERRWREHTTRT